MTILDVLSVLLVAVTVVSHVPQYIWIYAFQSSAGISPTSTLLLALAAQTQVVQMYYLFAIHPDTRYGNVVPKPIKPRQWLDLAQIVVQWICSVILFMLILTQSSTSSSELSATSTNNRPLISRKPALALLLFFHALFSVLLIWLAGKSLRQLNNIFFLIVMGANAYIAIPCSTLATLWAFYSQAQHIQSASVPSALSRASLILQATTFLALAFLWPFRLTLPQNLWRGQDALPLAVEWFCILGWTHVNSIIIAFGQFVVLYALAVVENNHFLL